MQHGRIKNKQRNITDFIQLNTSECRGCFICIKACPEGVISKINILIHKHALIRDSSKCTGCGKCVNVCGTGAISRIQKAQVRDI